MSARVLPLADVGAGLVEDWRRLAADALEPNPFAGPDLVLPAGRWLGDRGAAVVVVERAGELRFVLPTVPVRHVRRVPVPALAGWTHDYAFLGTPLVSADDPEGSWAEALGAMGAQAPWAVLEQLASDGPVAAALRTAQAVRGRSLSDLTRPGRPVLRRRPGTDYLALLSGNRRSKLRRLRPRLAKGLGEVRVVDTSEPGPELEQAVDGFLAMEARGWKGADGGAMARRPGHAEFFRDVCRRSAEAGALQLRALEAGGTTLGYQCNVLAGGTLSGFKTTFDEDHRRWSPGVVLVLDTIERFWADASLDLYDSCMGTDPSPLADLFPDRRGLSDVLVSLNGPLGQVATRLTPRAATAARRARSLRRAVGDRVRPRAEAGS